MNMWKHGNQLFYDQCFHCKERGVSAACLRPYNSAKISSLMDAFPCDFDTT